eukprot:scaffold335953_cov15-Prasinocladus_malaysianus.AAC.1
MHAAVSIFIITYMIFARRLAATNARVGYVGQKLAAIAKITAGYSSDTVLFIDFQFTKQCKGSDRDAPNMRR